MDIIDAFTIEEVKEITFREYREYYNIGQIKIELGPPEEFDYEAEGFDDWTGAPSGEQISNAEIDAQYERREREKNIQDRVTKCEDCGVQVIYKTKPHKRCAECKRKHDRERKRLTRS